MGAGRHATLSTAQSSAQYCRYGADKLNNFVVAMIAEIPGVRSAKDIECIHRMRVASRRARSALKLFGACFPDHMLKHWQKGVRSVTRSLGAARDLDVQIDVLKKFREANTQIDLKMGINHVLYHIRQKRRETQKDVITSIDKMKKKNLLHEIMAYLQKSQEKDVPIKESNPSQFILHQARTNIIDQLDGLLEYRSYTNQEDADEELHQMRIAAKRLRYTMEIFSDLYGEEFIVFIKATKKLQKYLGEMHDCVVWLAYLSKFLQEEKKHTRRYKRTEERLRAIERGVHYFEVNRKKFRGRKYRDFFKHWQEITAMDLFGKLRKYLTEKTASRKPRTVHREGKRKA